MLTPRLNMIAEHVNTKTVADIGTDHAYIPIYLAQNNLIDKAIATDLRKGPLSIAKSNIEKYGLSEKIELRLGSGVVPIKKNEVESYIIAGMGGELIKNILYNDKEKVSSADYLILQPMNSQDLLRKWLSENDFSVLEEDIAFEEHKVYNLIIARSGNPVIYENEFDLHIPHYLYNHKNFSKLKEKKWREFNKIKTGLEKASEKNNDLIKKYSDFIYKLERI